MQYPYLSTFKKVLQYFHSRTSVLPRQYWSTGKEVLATIKGPVNQNLLFIATKLINFCKLNTKINSII